MLSAREIKKMAACMAKNWLTKCYAVVEPGDEEKQGFGYYRPSIVGKLPLPVPTRGTRPIVTQLELEREIEDDDNTPYKLIIPNLEKFRELTDILDKRNVFTTRREYENPNFVSNDQQENDDINSQEWDIMRNLSSERDRRQHAMNAFGNSKPANPTKNLSYFGFLRKRLTSRREIKQTYDPVRLENGRLTFEDTSPFNR